MNNIKMTLAKEISDKLCYKFQQLEVPEVVERDIASYIEESKYVVVDSEELAKQITLVLYGTPYIEEVIRTTIMEYALNDN